MQDRSEQYQGKLNRGARVLNHTMVSTSRSPLATRESLPGFTLTELIVSITLLVMIMLGVNLIFGLSTKSVGQAESADVIMRHLRTFEDQMGRDLRGLRTDGFFALKYARYQEGAVDIHENTQAEEEGRIFSSNAEPRMDRMVFFANGDYQTIYNRFNTSSNSFDADGSPIYANMARIYYGQDESVYGPTPLVANRFVLCRRAKLLSADLDDDTNNDNPPFPPLPGGYGNSPTRYDAWEYEYISFFTWNHEIPTWTNIPFALNDHRTDNARTVSWIRRPAIDMAAVPDVNPTGDSSSHLLMLPGVAGFKVQRWAVTAPPGINSVADPDNPASFPRWFPEEDPNQDGDTNDSDFVHADSAENEGQYRVLADYFNGPPPGALSDPWDQQLPGDWPTALKFTITFADPKERLELQTYEVIVEIPKQ